MPCKPAARCAPGWWWRPTGWRTRRPARGLNLNINLNSILELNLNAQQGCRALRARLVVAPNGVAYAPASAWPNSNPKHNLHLNLNLNLKDQQACRPLRARLVVAPNGVAYAPASARPGVVPRLLREILATRVMVKAGMKRAGAGARVLQRVLNARQFGLKLIANVTYGYTAAGFSGRMPCAELADSIVQSARETLEDAIRMVEAHPGALGGWVGLL